LAQFRDELAMMMGGYVIEKMIFGDGMISTGPSSDLKHATKTAKDMVTRYGMSDKLGPRTFGEHEEMIFLGKEIHEQRDYSDKTAEEIDKEVKALVEEGEKRAKEIIGENKVKMEELVKELMEKETIEQDEIIRVLGQRPLAQ
jgi:cell division protease FtsH